MKARVTKPDGTVIELDGTPQEIAEACRMPYTFTPAPVDTWPYRPGWTYPAWPTWPYGPTWTVGETTTDTLTSTAITIDPAYHDDDSSYTGPRDYHGRPRWGHEERDRLDPGRTEGGP